MNNDLISREALKKTFENACIYGLPMNELYGAILKIIDNAPTEERPQGKWIKIFENPYVNGYVCPFCGHKIQVTEQFLPKVTECEACGADMRKGGAE